MACNAAAAATIGLNLDDHLPSHVFQDSGIPMAIGVYHEARSIRNGRSSHVFRAQPPKTLSGLTSGQKVALKVTNPSLMAEPHDSYKEARILKGLTQDHIIPLLDSFRQPSGHFVLVFPFMTYDLQGLLDDKRVSKEQGKSHLQGLFSGLGYLHSFGIIHRDIKPSNILLKTPSGPAYLADFGIAWSPTDAGSEKADDKITDVGTTCYRPPELLFGNKKYDCSLDLWAAGCVAAEVVSSSGTSLFDSGNLGSELALIQSIFKNMGTPNLQTWPVMTVADSR